MLFSCDMIMTMREMSERKVRLGSANSSLRHTSYVYLCPVQKSLFPVLNENLAFGGFHMAISSQGRNIKYIKKGEDKCFSCVHIRGNLSKEMK